MNVHSGGHPTARSSAVLCLIFLLVSGCGTVTPSPTTSGSTGSGSAASAKVAGGPQLGLVWNAADSTLRALYGVPGATQLGAPLFAAGSYATAAFSAQTQTALLVDGKGNLAWMTLPSASPQRLTQGIPPGASIAFSPKGGNAVVYASGGASVLTISGLPQLPVTATVSSAAPIVAAAISDAGTLLLATSAGSNSVAVATLPAGGTRSTLTTLGGYGGMNFLSGSEDILLSDSAANTLTRWHNGNSSILATHASGLNTPFAVAASLDDHWAVAADRSDSNLVRVDLTGATAPAQYPCGCVPSQLSALSGNAVFELAAPGKSPGWMIEADDPVARMLFIPAARSGQ